MIRDLGEKLFHRLPSAAFLINDGAHQWTPEKAVATLVHPKLPFEVKLTGKLACRVINKADASAVRYGATMSVFPENHIARILKPNFDPRQHAPVLVLDNVKVPFDGTKFATIVKATEKKVKRRGLIMTFT